MIVVRQIHTKICTFKQHEHHKFLNISTNMYLAHLSPSALDAYVRDPTPMASEGCRERSDSGKARFFPCARAWLDCRGFAGKKGTAALRGPTAGSNSTSYASWLRWKRSYSISSDGESDTTCGRYIQKYVHLSNTNINSINLQICISTWCIRGGSGRSTSGRRMPHPVRLASVQTLEHEAALGQDCTGLEPGLVDTAVEQIGSALCVCCPSAFFQKNRSCSRSARDASTFYL